MMEPSEWPSAPIIGAENAKTAALTSVPDATPAAGSRGELLQEGTSHTRVKRYPRPSIDEIKKLEAEKLSEVDRIRQELSKSAKSRQQVRAIRERYQAELQSAKAAFQEAQQRWRELLDRKRAVQERLRESTSASGPKTSAPAVTRKYRSVAEVDARIAELEGAQAHSTLSLSDEKRLISELTYLRIHAREEARRAEIEHESRREQVEKLRLAREELEAQRRELDDALNKARTDLDRQRDQLDELRKRIDRQVEEVEAAAGPVNRESLQARMAALRQEIQSAWDSFRESDRQWKENERLWWEQERQARQERREAEAARRREQWKQRELARLREEPVDPYIEQKHSCDLVLRALQSMLPEDDAIQAEIRALLPSPSPTTVAHAISSANASSEAAAVDTEERKAHDAADQLRGNVASLAGFRPVGKVAADRDGVDELYARKPNKTRGMPSQRYASKHAVAQRTGPARRQTNALNFAAEVIFAFHKCGVQVPAAMAEVAACAAQAVAAKKAWQEKSQVFLENERSRRLARIQALENDLDIAEDDASATSSHPASTETSTDLGGVLKSPPVYSADTDPHSVVKGETLHREHAPVPKLVPSGSQTTPPDTNAEASDASVRKAFPADDDPGHAQVASTRQALNDDDFLALRTADGNVVTAPSGPVVQGVWASRASTSLIGYSKAAGGDPLQQVASSTSWPDALHTD
jgi:chromosome segregation ATPase